MAGDDADRVSGGLANMNIGDDDDNVAASPAASGVSSPQGTQLPRGAQPLSSGAAGGPLDGESAPVVHAHVVINGQNSREAIHAFGVKLAALNAARAASAARVDHVTQGDMDIGDGRMEVPRPSYNRQWLSVVLTYAKDRKYDGLSLVPQTHDQKTRFQYYEYNVSAVIRLCEGPRFDLEDINLVES
jgi:hypothetical protein